MMPRELPELWRTDAEVLRGYGDTRGAEILERVAGQLETAIREGEREELNLTEAAEVSGYSKRRLRELVADGTIPNQGRKGSPRLLRGDLPTKPRSGRGKGSYSPSDDARAILGRVGGGR